MTHVKQLTRSNIVAIEDDMHALALRIGLDKTQYDLVQYRNPENRVVMAVRSGNHAGVYDVTKGKAKWLGHNGYLFGALENI